MASPAENQTHPDSQTLRDTVEELTAELAELRSEVARLRAGIAARHPSVLAPPDPSEWEQSIAAQTDPAVPAIPSAPLPSVDDLPPTKGRPARPDNPASVAEAPPPTRRSKGADNGPESTPMGDENVLVESARAALGNVSRKALANFINLKPSVLWKADRTGLPPHVREALEKVVAGAGGGERDEAVAPAPPQPKVSGIWLRGVVSGPSED